jgi:hypothetical protein
MNKLIKQYMNEFEFVQKMNELNLNILFSLILNLKSTRVQNKIKQFELKN